MAANAFPGEILDGPISKYFCIYVFYVCAKFHTCIIKRTIHSRSGSTIGYPYEMTILITVTSFVYHKKDHMFDMGYDL